MAVQKYGGILNDLRMEIVGGRFKPGSRLPTRVELQRRFGVSNQTIQVAINSLIRDGFVHTSGIGGTIVSDNPPHLCRYGLVSYIPFSESRFLLSMQRAAMRLAEEGGCTFTSYCYEEAHIETEGYRRLIEDVESHRVAGLIFLNPPYNLEDTPVLVQKGLPRVAHGRARESDTFPCIMFDHRLFLEKSVGHLAGIGRRRIAVIGSYLHREEMEEDISYLAARKLSSPKLTQNCTPWHPWSARQAALLLMGLSEKERPDALIIRDDHLVEAATEGLARTGVRIPEEMTVVAHCNFPDRPPSCVPVMRLGLDCDALIRLDVKSLSCQREGKRRQPDILVPAVFEHEALASCKNMRQEGRAMHQRASGLQAYQ